MLDLELGSHFGWLRLPLARHGRIVAETGNLPHTNLEGIDVFGFIFRRFFPEVNCILDGA